MTLPLRLLPALVLGTTEESCTVVRDGGVADVTYAAPFPGPRAERVSPGHVVAVAALPDGRELVVWRWYDAVVLGETAEGVRLWEPGHGEVLAQPRDPSSARSPGSRAYLSAGLPGAEWWVAGPVVQRAEDADVETDAVVAFFAEVGLWERLG